MHLLDLKRRAGQNAAFLKVGTAPGTIDYAPRKDSEPFDNAANEQEETWMAFDRRSGTAQDASTLGLPIGGDVKAASATGDTYSSADPGVADGGVDATASKPFDYRQQYQSSAISDAFRSNENYDPSSAMDPPMTQPQGSKTATIMGAGTNFSSISAPKPPSIPAAGKMPKVPSITDPRADKPPGMNLQHSVTTKVDEADSAANYASPQKRLMGSAL